MTTRSIAVAGMLNGTSRAGREQAGAGDVSSMPQHRPPRSTAGSSRLKMVETTKTKKTDAQSAFKLYDMNGDGSIGFKEMCGALKDLSIREGISKVRRDNLEAEFKNADLDSNGKISEEEFIAFYNRFISEARAKSKTTAAAAALKSHQRGRWGPPADACWAPTSEEAQEAALSPAARASLDSEAGLAAKAARAEVARAKAAAQKAVTLLRQPVRWRALVLGGSASCGLVAGHDSCLDTTHGLDTCQVPPLP